MSTGFARRMAMCTVAIAGCVSEGELIRPRPLPNAMDAASSDTNDEPRAPPVRGVVARAADSFVDSVGIRVDLGSADTPYLLHFDDLVLPMLARLGVRHVHDAAPKAPDPAYGQLAQMGARGVKCTLSFDPRGLIPASDIPADVALVKDAIEGVEGPPDYSVNGVFLSDQDTRAYMTDMRATLVAAGIALPVLAPTAGDRVKLGELGSLVDFGNVHLPRDGHPPTSALPEALQTASLVSGDRPVVITEFGYSNALPVFGTLPNPQLTTALSEGASARYILRGLLEFFSRGVARTFVVQLCDPLSDDPKQPLGELTHTGLLRNDGTRKPAFDALATLLTILADQGPAFTPSALAYVLRGDTNDVHQLLLQKRDGQFYLALWQEVTSFDLRGQRDLSVVARHLEVELDQAVDGVSVLRPLVSSMPDVLAGLRTSIPLDVSDDVLIVQMTVAPP